MDRARVTAVSLSAAHGVGKHNQDRVHLLAGVGVEGDVHSGSKVKHRSRVARDAEQPNLRQVHLIHGELHDELRSGGFDVAEGEMGENVTTRGVDLLALPKGAIVRLGPDAVVEITGLRNPCTQLEALQAGLMAACLGRTADGEPVRKAGVMSVVLAGGEVRAGDVVVVELPAGPHEALKPV